MLRKGLIRYTGVLLLCLVIILLLTAPRLEQKAQAQSSSVTRGDLILAMNTLRVSNGLPALIEDPIVNAVAQSTADIMAANNMSWHIGDVRGRLAAAGYGAGATVWATENFAVGNMGIDEIMQVWADPDHMLPAVIPSYCHVGAGVSQSADGRFYYVLQAAYTSEHSCGEYVSVQGDPGGGTNPQPSVSQIIIPVKVATPDADGRIYHIVKSGQSFWSIAIAYQITIRDLEVWNNLSRDIPLWVGQELFIPSVGTEGYATPTPVGMVQLATPGQDGKIIHEVQPYQVLIKIAEAYDIDLDRILALNGWQVDWPLQIGQRLLIDPGNITPSATPRPLSEIERLTPASDGNYYHTVQSGEYLAYIASLYEITLNELMAWNGLNADSILRPGQQLLLLVTPPPTPTATPAPPTATPTVTFTPREPTQSLTPTTVKEKITETPIQAAESGFSSMRIPLVISLVVIGLLILGWVVLQLRSRDGAEGQG